MRAKKYVWKESSLKSMIPGGLFLSIFRPIKTAFTEYLLTKPGMIHWWKVVFASPGKS